MHSIEKKYFRQKKTIQVRYRKPVQEVTVVTFGYWYYHLIFFILLTYIYYFPIKSSNF